MAEQLPPLAANPCRSLCSWHATPAFRAGEKLFACRGCGSQWSVSEQWTPIDCTGHIPDAVRTERLGSRGSGANEDGEL